MSLNQVVVLPEEEEELKSSVRSFPRPESPLYNDPYYSQILPMSPPHDLELPLSPLWNFSPGHYDVSISLQSLAIISIPSLPRFGTRILIVLDEIWESSRPTYRQHGKLWERTQIQQVISAPEPETLPDGPEGVDSGTWLQRLADADAATTTVNKKKKIKQSLTICERTKKSSVQLEDLQQHSHMSVEEAAGSPDAGESTLEPLCKGKGISQWSELENISLSEKTAKAGPSTIFSFTASPSAGAVGCSFGSASLNRCNRASLLTDTRGISLITSMEINMDEQSIDPVKSAPDQLETFPDGIEMMIPSSSDATIETRGETKVGDVGISVQSLAATTKSTMAKKQNKRKISPIKGGRSKKSVHLVDLQNYSHLTLEEAARSLDVSKSTLKRRCRENGISEWSELKDINLSEKSADISFTLETLLQHSNKGLEEAAKALDVSETTLQHKDQKISQWSGLRLICLSEKGNQCSLTTNRHSGDAINTFRSEMAVQQIQDYGGMNHQFCFQPRNQSVTISPPETTMQDVRLVTIKATYEKKMIKFKLFPWSKIEDLEEEVTRRLKLELGSFHLEYEDEEGDSILIGCDSDLKDCMDTLRSLDRTTVKMLVSPITS